MAAPRQAPAPYDGMGTPTRWDSSTHDDGTPAELLDTARADRFPAGPPRHDESEEFVRRSLNRFYR
ncbi:MAG TPA: hypothetical protein VND54_08125 [Candidatus Saccharimonadales bacterium]|nr:hypothetical protein [Candidatus Saccharimonadales bacterium]